MSKSDHVRMLARVLVKNQDKAAISHMEQSPAATACDFRPYWAMYLIRSRCPWPIIECQPEETGDLNVAGFEVSIIALSTLSEAHLKLI